MAEFIKGGGGTASFDQAAFQMQRVDELFVRIDRMSINLFSYDYDLELYNYEVVFNDLNTVFSTISAKCSDDEIKYVYRFRELVRQTISTFPVFTKSRKNSFNGARPVVQNKSNQNIITDILLDYRLHIEYLADKRGFGNPSKKDPTKAVVN